MNRRWILALTAAVGVAMLTVPLLMEERSAAPTAETTELDVPSLASSAGPVCKTHAAGNLDFTLKDMNGASVHLADYKGKVVLVNFWATWCGPCKKEIPDLSKLYKQYKDKGVVMLGVLTNDNPSQGELLNFQSDYEMEFPVVRQTSDILVSFNYPQAIPTTFIYDRAGHRVGKPRVGAIKPDEMASTLEQLLR